MKKVCMKLNNAFENDSRVLKEATSLGEAGYRVTIIAKHKEGLKGVEAFGKFTVKRIKKDNIIPMYSIIKALWVEDADIHHAHDLDSLPPSYFVAKLKGKKLVYDSHEYWRGFDEEKLYSKRRIFLLFEGFMIRGSQLLISVNKAIVDKIAKNAKYNGNKVVLYNAPYYKGKAEKTKKPGSDISIIHIGAIQQGRGIEPMLEAIKLLPKEYNLYFLGPDNYPGGIEGLARKMGVLERVVYLGSVKPEEVKKKASFADLGLVLTQGRSENYYLSLPNKFFESISIGLPLVTSDMKIISEIVKKEKIGTTCDVKDPKDIARKIQEVYSSKEKYAKNLEKTAKKYSWENQAKKLVKAYTEL